MFMCFINKTKISFLLFTFVLTFSLSVMGMDEAESTRRPSIQREGTQLLSAFLFQQNDENLPETVVNVVKDTNVVFIDFSLINIKDEQLVYIVNGLKERKHEIDSHRPINPLPTFFINLKSHDITLRGFEEFLRKLQRCMEEHTIPNVGGMILKISFNITDDFVEKCQGIAPSLISDGIQIIE